MVGVMPPPVVTKRDMYVRMGRGEFGNSLPQWTDWEEWTAAEQGRDKYELWGVRSQTANDPRTKLNVHRGDVFSYLDSTGLLRDAYQLSAMVDQAANVVAELQMYQATDGLHLEGNFAPVAGHGQWRNHMRSPRSWSGAVAIQVLRAVANDNSFDDLLELLCRYPDHVVEFTALDATFGTHPGRNCVVWEVRRY